MKWEALAAEPALWGVANASDPWEDIDAALSRSQNTSLDIRWRGYGSVVDEEEFLDTVSSHVDRWRSVEFLLLLPESLDLLGSLSAPRMTDLRVSAKGRPVIAHLFGGNLAHLRHLSLSRISVQWNAMNVCNLSTLRLSNLGRFSPSIDQLVEILKSSPDLLDLEIEVLIHDDPPTAGTPVDLRSLTRLKLSFLSQRYIHNLFTAVQIPDTVQLYVIISFFEDDDVTDFSPLLISRCRSTLTKAQAGSITVVGDDAMVWTPKASWPVGGSLQLEVLGLSSHDMLRILSAFLPPPSAGVEITLIFDGTASPQDCQQIFGRLPCLSITQMELIDSLSASVANAFLSLLTSRTVSLDGTWIWPFPRLQVLKLTNARRLNAATLIDVIRQRYDLGRNEQGLPALVEHVSPMTTLLIEGRDAPKPADVQALVDVLGSDVVEWRCTS